MAATTMAVVEETQVGDLPESCLAHVIALTSPRDACRCAAVSPSFRPAAESDAVWDRFLPPDYHAILPQATAPGGATACSGHLSSKKDAYLGLCHNAVLVDDGKMRVWLEKESGVKCYALSARKLSLPWEDGEFSWRWTPHPLSRFGEVAQLMDCTCLDIYGRLPTAALTPGTGYAAYLVFGTAEGHRGLRFPDQETTVAVGGRVASRHAVCLRPDDADAHKFRGVGLGGGDDGGLRRPTRRVDGWSEVEMGRLHTDEAMAVAKGDEVVASFEVLGWYPKRGLVVEGIGNFVRLLGYTISGDLRVLVYEFAAMGTLHDVLHGPRIGEAQEPEHGRPVLSWEQRAQIALDAARGLEYLHEKVRPAMTHKDVRSTNVLLFEGFRAKIADYNMFSQAADMARLNRSTHTLGSFGYQAPEYAMMGQMTDKSDVYSFGIVLLELLTGRKPLDRTLPQGQRSLVNWATPLLTEDRVQECIDPNLGDQYPTTGALKLGRIAVQCLQYDPTFRPSMGTVARVINYAVVRDQQGVV